MTGAAFICEKNVNYLYILSLELVGLAQTHMHTCWNTYAYVYDKQIKTKNKNRKYLNNVFFVAFKPVLGKQKLFAELAQLAYKR